MNLTLICIIGLLLIYGIIVSIIVVYYFCADILFWWKARKIRKIERHPATPFQDLETFLRALETGSLQRIKGGGKIDFPTLNGDTFTMRARAFWGNKKDSDNALFRRIETGWLLSAILDNDHYWDYIQSYFDTTIKHIPIEVVDQCPFGVVALSLYEKTKDVTYKNYADKMYEWLLSQDTSYGVLYRKGQRCQLVDTSGFITPFLVRYGWMFSVQEASKLAEKTISKYLKYGCDKETSLPAFQYSLSEPHIKLGAANWGRGCGWLMIGLSYINIENLEEENQKLVHTLESTLIELWNNDGIFGHFLGEFPRDLSAELPIVYYLYKKNLINLDEKHILAYSEMCHDGMMYCSSSANMGIIKYGVPHGTQTLSQEYMMRLINLYKGRHSIKQ